MARLRRKRGGSYLSSAFEEVEAEDPRGRVRGGGSRASRDEATEGDLPIPVDMPSEDAMDPYAGLKLHRREHAILAAAETLTEIERTQASTRNREGKLRRAKFISAILGLRYEGFTPRQTAETLGCSLQQVTYALSQIRKDATLDAQVQRLTAIAVPLAMDNAIRGVMDGDKDYTLRVLDGAGVFRTHKSVQGEIKQTITSLSVVLQVPAHLEGKPLPLPKAGSIMGAPTIASGLPPAQCLEGIVVESPRVPVVGVPGTPGELEIRD